MVFHVESISSATFVDHIVYQIGLDVYRILPDRRALFAILLAPLEVKIALSASNLRNDYRLDRGRSRSARCQHQAAFRRGGAVLRAVSFAQQSIGRPPRT